MKEQICNKLREIEKTENVRILLPEELVEEVKHLLDLKMNAPEVKQISRIDKINACLDASIEKIKGILQSMEEKKDVEWGELNALFLKTVR